MIKGLKFKQKKAAAFGSYGWSGEAAKQIGEKLAEAGLTVVDEGRRAQWVPDGKEIEACREYGRAFAAAVRGE